MKSNDDGMDAQTDRVKHGYDFVDQNYGCCVVKDCKLDYCAACVCGAAGKASAPVLLFIGEICVCDDGPRRAPMLKFDMAVAGVVPP